MFTGSKLDLLTPWDTIDCAITELWSTGRVTIPCDSTEDWVAGETLSGCFILLNSIYIYHQVLAILSIILSSCNSPCLAQLIQAQLHIQTFSITVRDLHEFLHLSVVSYSIALLTEVVAYSSNSPPNSLSILLYNLVTYPLYLLWDAYRWVCSSIGHNNKQMC